MVHEVEDGAYADQVLLTPDESPDGDLGDGDSDLEKDVQTIADEKRDLVNAISGLKSQAEDWNSRIVEEIKKRREGIEKRLKEANERYDELVEKAKKVNPDMEIWELLGSEEITDAQSDITMLHVELGWIDDELNSAVELYMRTGGAWADAQTALREYCVQWGDGVSPSSSNPDGYEGHKLDSYSYWKEAEAAAAWFEKTVNRLKAVYEDANSKWKKFLADNDLGAIDSKDGLSAIPDDLRGQAETLFAEVEKACDAYNDVLLVYQELMDKSSVAETGLRLHCVGQADDDGGDTDEGVDED